MPSSLAVVLRSTPYSDTHNITSIYTQQWGLQAIRIPKGNGRSRSLTQSWRKTLQPLRIVELQTLREPSQGFVVPTEILLRGGVMDNIIPNPVRMAMVFFIAEFTERIVRNFPPDEQLYSFVHQSVEILQEISSSQVANFHLAYLVGMLRWLGYLPEVQQLRFASEQSFFDLNSGQFVSTQGKYTIPPQEARFVATMVRINYRNMHRFQFDRQQRTRTLQLLLTYYHLHNADVGSLRTLDVLQQIFS